MKARIETRVELTMQDGKFVPSSPSRPWVVVELEVGITDEQLAAFSSQGIETIEEVADYLGQWVQDGLKQVLDKSAPQG